MSSDFLNKPTIKPISPMIKNPMSFMSEVKIQVIKLTIPLNNESAISPSCAIVIMVLCVCRPLAYG